MYRWLSSLIVLALVSGVTAGAVAPCRGPAELPPSVDLRTQFDKRGLKPRKQGKRSTCSVFVVAASLEFALARQQEKATELSVEYLNWACNQLTGNRKSDRGHFFDNLLNAFDRYGICPEQDMPYVKESNPKLRRPSKKAVHRAKRIREAGLEVHWVKPRCPKGGLTEDQFFQIKSVLAGGWPVGAGAGHSRLLVGYHDDPRRPGGGLFLTKDSGSGSYETVTYEFVKKEVCDVFWIESHVKPSSKDNRRGVVETQ